MLTYYDNQNIQYVQLFVVQLLHWKWIEYRMPENNSLIPHVSITYVVRISLAIYLYKVYETHTDFFLFCIFLIFYSLLVTVIFSIFVLFSVYTELFEPFAFRYSSWNACISFSLLLPLYVPVSLNIFVWKDLVMQPPAIALVDIGSILVWIRHFAAFSEFSFFQYSFSSSRFFFSIHLI